MPYFYLSALLLLVFSPAGAAPPAPEPFALTVEAQPGDGIYSLLRRYQLDGFSCNFAEFYRLNDLKKNSSLRIGRTYQLPIKVYTYNGKSIRSTIGNNDWDTAVSIQKYNERLTAEGVRIEDFRKDKILWLPFHLLNCPTENLDIPAPAASTPVADAPRAGSDAANASKDGENAIALRQPKTTTGKRRFAIFGEQHAYVPLIDTKLSGKVYYIVAGHGGPDPGAMTKTGDYTLCEDEYAYDVALRLCRNLIAHGATAYMINRDNDDGIREGKYLDCDNDEKLWGDISMYRGQKARLFQRSNIINTLYETNKSHGVTEQLMVAIHVDSRNRRERIDLFFYHHGSSEVGKQRAEKMQQAMQRRYKQHRADGSYHGNVSARDLHMLREVKAPGVYVELANIRNAADQQRIILARNRQLLADWLLEGMMN